ncbi:large-conductance mechanosensitive channel protein MscL [Clostridium sp. 1001275B_160808_H3]|uniref:large-conductance mechanosensitive channel protein MscL n=1 Tax=Clostridium sp. 1001275B_160808_H3 TaxID=2787110 RepID=UPI001897EB96|nr:large-conductance mechanosensitive channel protein MscL [Clostridium sp. 1001275B_160808_H3]
MKEKGKKFISEFKDFAMKGNVLDLAIGVIIGGAFNKIVSSLVKDIIMPPIGVLTGGVNFSDLSYVLKPAVEGVSDAVTLNYGLFIQNIVDFLIIALSIFIFIKIVNKLNGKKEEEAKKEEEKKKLTVEQELLTEIRNLLKNQPEASEE